MNPKIIQVESSLLQSLDLVKKNRFQEAKVLIDLVIDLVERLPNQSLNDLLAEPQTLYKDGQYELALDILNELKARRISIEGLDLIRSKCFKAIGQDLGAYQATLEELRYFPNNQEAHHYLKTVDLNEQTQIQDHEFQFLFNQIKSYTMVGERRLYQIYLNTKKICLEDKLGNFVECGVAAGGTSGMMAYLIKKYSQRPRKLYSFDSFEGMPEPTEHDMHAGVSAQDSGWGTGTCSSPEDSVKEIATKLGAIEILNPVKGYFCDTLPIYREEIGQIAFLHMDGDWYESTMDILKHLYAQTDQGAYIQIDDYGHWEGCRKAIQEWEQAHGLKFNLTKIDGTGVYLFKPDACILPNTTPSTSNLRMVNLGCGGTFHETWENYDYSSSHSQVQEVDLTKPLPFQDHSVDVIYSSHMLEHFTLGKAKEFLNECYRVLKPNGVIRLVVPDLEGITRSYLNNLEAIRRGDQVAIERYNWTVIELLDQMVRLKPGGEMLNYWKKSPMPAKDFVVDRVGKEAKLIIDRVQGSAIDSTEPSTHEIADYRSKGEIHQWMYDEFSLTQLLSELGFSSPIKKSADQSQIPSFNSFGLDLNTDSSIRKPDSLFVEARK